MPVAAPPSVNGWLTFVRQWAVLLGVVATFATVVGYATHIQSTLDSVRTTESRHCELTRAVLVLAVESSRGPAMTDRQTAAADRIVAAFRGIDCA